MPRLRKTHRLERRDWTDEHREQLVSGQDWFHMAWGNLHDWPMNKRNEWPGPEVLEGMRAAWSELGDELLEQHTGERPLFAELVFGRGTSPREALKVHRERKTNGT